MSGNGSLRAVIEAAGRAEKASLNDLTVLSAQVDPYRLDTEAGHRDGRWLAEHLARLGYLDRAAIERGDHRRVHLRGLHYALVAQATVLKPDGGVYRNTAEDWDWLQQCPAKRARWLGYVPFDVIADARNAEPVIHRRRRAEPRAHVFVGLDVKVPSADDLHPRADVSGFEGRQPYHTVIFGEKTSLDEALGPVARHFHCDLYLPSGEISDTLLYQMARDGAADGRPMVVFTFADCDPAGWQMPVSIGRKLQAFRDLLFPQLAFEVRPVALTAEQVRGLDLPSTPLKATERRADRWRQAFGIEQTEIDALAALRPDLLRRIAEDAIQPFFDETLASRVSAERARWRSEAQSALDGQIDANLLDRLHAEASEKLAALQEEIEAINNALRLTTADLDLRLPPLKVPEPRADGLQGFLPLVSSAWDWSTASRALIARKAYGDGEVRP